MPTTSPQAKSAPDGSMSSRPASARRIAANAKQLERSQQEAAMAPELAQSAADALLSFQSVDDEAQYPRMSHKQVEQHRRLKAKLYFEELRAMLPAVDARSDRNKVLAVAIDHIKDLQGIPIAPGTRASERAGLRGDIDDEDMMFEMEDAQKMSHNVVEQRRRHLAKGYFDELRALLPHPQAAKFDKNTVLQHTVALLKKLQSRIGSDASESEGQQASESDVADNSASLSHSPNDVTAFASNFGSAPASKAQIKREQEVRKGRKRSPELSRNSRTPSGSEQDIFDMEMDDGQDHKRTRRACTAGDGSGKECECESCGDERACFAALSLLSEVALSVPNTPLLAPGGAASPKNNMAAMDNLVLSA